MFRIGATIAGPVYKKDWADAVVSEESRGPTVQIKAYEGHRARRRLLAPVEM